MGNVRSIPDICVRKLTVEDKGYVVQQRGEFGMVTTAENGIFIVMFRHFCQFKFEPYNGQDVVLFNAAVVVTPKLTTHQADQVTEHNSLSLYFGVDGGPLIVVDDSIPANPALYPGAPSKKPPARWRLFNMVTGEAFPSDNVPRQAYRHWTQDICHADGSITRLLDMNEKTVSLAIEKQHVLGIRG